ncbi:hypothetical protein I545_6561 [Mycobacterium kansasii 662]|uniref:Uncharacterized protein n=1 Tax=Mycobacterium kansasii 662 TaxID=1299326 RepID=X7YGR8_MYCKA|nr:hypothetical protein I545_6561 [Mycobacterium kansasii 662]
MRRPTRCCLTTHRLAAKLLLRACYGFRGRLLAQGCSTSGHNHAPAGLGGPPVAVWTCAIVVTGKPAKLLWPGASRRNPGPLDISDGRLSAGRG